MTLTQLQQAVAHLFPSASYGVTWTANTTSTGATIALWDNSIGAQPTTTQLSDALSAAQLADAKVAQDATLRKACDAQRYGTPVSVTVGSATVAFPTDTATQLNVMGYRCAFTATTAPSQLPLKDADAKTQQLTYGEVTALAEATAKASIAAWTKLESLQAQVAAATTIPDVQAVTW